MTTDRFQALLNAFEAQGARCGHIDGKCRHGAYVEFEEYENSYTAAHANTVCRVQPGREHWGNLECLHAWQRGYEAGYRVGADGQELDPETVNAPLPEEV